MRDVSGAICSSGGSMVHADLTRGEEGWQNRAGSGNLMV